MGKVTWACDIRRECCSSVWSRQRAATGRPHQCCRPAKGDIGYKPETNWHVPELEWRKAGLVTCCGFQCCTCSCCRGCPHQVWRAAIFLCSKPFCTCSCLKLQEWYLTAPQRIETIWHYGNRVCRHGVIIVCIPVITLATFWQSLVL